MNKIEMNEYEIKDAESLSSKKYYNRLNQQVSEVEELIKNKNYQQAGRIAKDIDSNLINADIPTLRKVEQYYYNNEKDSEQAYKISNGINNLEHIHLKLTSPIMKIGIIERINIELKQLYSKLIINLEKELYGSKNYVDFTVEKKDKQILAVLEMVQSENNSVIEQLLNYYQVITKNQRIIPKIFIFLEDVRAWYELDVISKQINKINTLPSYEDLISFANSNINESKDEKNQEEKKDTYIENNGEVTASLNNDNPDGEDKLSIMKDVRALSKVIAYKDLKPPLSIGLFGKWGSGKSFFMEKIEEEVKELSKKNLKESQQNYFCENIVHIRFNAWHYSDANLWASLVTNIFLELNNYINKKNTPIDKKVFLYNELESTKQLIKEKEDEKEDVEKLIKVNIENQKKLEQDKQENIFKLNNLKATDIKILILDDPEMKESFDDIKEKLHIKENRDLDAFYNMKDELNTTFGIYKNALQLFINDKNSRILVVSFFIVMIVLGLCTIYADTIKGVLTSVLSSVGIVVYTINKYLKILKPISTKLKRFLKNYNILKGEKLKEKDLKELKLIKEQTDFEIDLKQIKEKVKIENKCLINIELEIENIKSGKYLANFIAERSNSNDYKKHLGLISIIRNDFSKLVEHLKEPDNDAKYKIDRIVLYIDDLDRCLENTVIEVLEAVHLILAFELFVVVVGVDSRWVTHSLTNEYNALSDESKNKNNKATSYDYLEKIFQIPFKINSMSPESKEELIADLFKTDLEKKEVIKSSSEKNHAELLEINNGNEPKEDIEVEDIANQYEQLTISEEELIFIKNLSDLIANTPRSIKRFVNVYRIIRSHENIHYHDDKKHYKAIIFLLIILFSKPELLNGLDSDKWKKLFNNPEFSSVDKYIKDIKDMSFDSVENYLKLVERFSFHSFSISKDEVGKNKK